MTPREQLFVMFVSIVVVFATSYVLLRLMVAAWG